MTKQEVIQETKKHMERVGELVKEQCSKLMFRGITHDKSKLSKEEIDLFVEYTPSLKKVTYGSEEYFKCLKGLKPALDHHYANNPHHPEYHENGMNDMTLIDLLELICDWKASSERHENGDIEKSIDINKERFGISDQLANILKNTANTL